MLTLKILRGAQADLASIVQFIAATNPDAAGQFLDAVLETLELLQSFPDIGAKRACKSPRLQNVRMLPVRNFDRYILFYKSSRGVLRLMRVVHSARDFPRE